MGTVTYNDAWTTHGRPLTDDSPEPPDREDGSARSDGAGSAAAGGGSLGDMIQGWAESAFGPAITGVGRELGVMAKQLTGPGQIKNPWLWVGAAGVLGYALGRSGVLRPLAGFAVKTALTTFVERALRNG
jgi:hypothetical protein